MNCKCIYDESKQKVTECCNAHEDFIRVRIESVMANDQQEIKRLKKLLSDATQHAEYISMYGDDRGI